MDRVVASLLVALMFLFGIVYALKLVLDAIRFLLGWRRRKLPVLYEEDVARVQYPEAERLIVIPMNTSPNGRVKTKQ